MATFHRTPPVGANAEESLITLTDVAKQAPGRPSTNCIWRWCRKGLKSRNGERIRLQHVRLGGLIYTTRAWLDEFGRKLAAADENYFKLNDALSATMDVRGKFQPRSTSQFEQQRCNAIEDAERQLTKAGI